MFVRTKRQIQKSFRIDEDVERDLIILSKLTERSQNDLANVALEELLQDNKDYFLKVSIYEHFMKQLNLGKNEFDDFSMGGETVKMKYVDGDNVEIKSYMIIGGEMVDECTKVFDSDIGEDLREWLEQLSVYIDRDSEEVDEYLEKRTDYRDYVKIRKK